MSENWRDRHMVGFEKEAEFNRLWGHPDVRSRLYMGRDFMAVARVLRPELCAGVFERRACRRRLRYIGQERCGGGEDEDGDHEIGHIYHSIDFNGATYTIEETGALIGCAYFDVVE